MTDTILIAGAGHAAGQTIVSLRQGGYGGKLILVGEEPYLLISDRRCPRNFLPASSMYRDCWFARKSSTPTMKSMCGCRRG